MHRTSIKFCKSPLPTNFIAGLSLAARSFSTVARQNDRFKLPNAINNSGSSEFEGTLARTDSTVQVEHPSESDLPTSEPVTGRGGFHHKRTLPSFSLEGKVGVVTGGARGLGLMMSQSLIISGSDLAIVDLDSK
jgi:hypothetical protein